MGSLPSDEFFRLLFNLVSSTLVFFLLVLLFLAVIYYQMAIIFNGYVWLLRIERTIGREEDLNNINCGRKWHVKWGGIERMTFGRIEWLKSIYMADLISLLRIHSQLWNFRTKAWLLLMFDFLCIEVCLNKLLFYRHLEFCAVVLSFRIWMKLFGLVWVSMLTWLRWLLGKSFSMHLLWLDCDQWVPFFRCCWLLGVH